MRRSKITPLKLRNVKMAPQAQYSQNDTCQIRVHFFSIPILAQGKTPPALHPCACGAMNAAQVPRQHRATAVGAFAEVLGYALVTAQNRIFQVRDKTGLAAFRVLTMSSDLVILTFDPN